MDYEKQYRQAEKSYIQGDYEEAATIIHRLAEEFSQDPSVLLLRGHIYCCFEQYDLAQQQYELVLQVSDEQDFLQCAHNALEQLHQFQTQGEVAEEE
ncbi:MAG: methyl-accepting chemotaxis protein, partial [Cyanobacteria bacterium QH_8_48_120]